MIGNRTIAVPGPTNVPNRIAQSMNIPMEDHRAPDLGDFVKPLLHDIKDVFKTVTGTILPESSKILVIPIFLPSKPLIFKP